MRNDTSAIWLGTLFISVLSALAGCTNSQNDKQTSSGPVAATFELPPKDMVEAIRAAVTSPPTSMSVESEANGVLTTSWKRFQGDFHIARHWQEQTRFMITVSPDWQNPQSRCTVSIVAETQQRRAEGQQFEPAPELNRNNRSQELMNQIREFAARQKPTP